MLGRLVVPVLAVSMCKRLSTDKRRVCLFLTLVAMEDAQ